MNNEPDDTSLDVASDRNDDMITPDGADDELPSSVCIARYFEGIRTLSAHKHPRCLSSELYCFLKKER
ncbi:hypothetical protein U14_05152 [Candidatus Moduliflexus flocculans]|uniref:Uncharacterized protein n=1 Tax=Candidatus Moduliflexus flocculans TaxID=1499966 RepID=A0A081BR46_9BACT|nr:hypothetical protein U14_05152 [Candidatus Moduliflexus flocculans]